MGLMGGLKMHNKCSTNVSSSSGGMHLFEEREEEGKPGKLRKIWKTVPIMTPPSLVYQSLKTP